MHASLCVCGILPRIETATRVVLFLHRSEDRKSTNTGRLAASCLTNSEVIVRGHVDQPSAPWTCGDRFTPVLLFPHEGAIPIERFVDRARGDRPLALVVPDGTWKQAARVRHRVPGLHELPCVSLGTTKPAYASLYRLRTEAHPGRLATIEAIAHAMEILEGPDVRRALEHVFRAMVERTLWARGDVATEAVTGGVPPGVMRHDPRSGMRRPT